tara:strand:- start:110 stop:475 length:366 start_codon:yes stop_codon:yes gene_type:complete
MADICPVCNKKIGFVNGITPQDGIDVHESCITTFFENPELYGGKAIENKYQTKEEKEAIEQKRKEQQQKIEDQSVYVKGFSMPFGEMVEFMVKWAIASIPAFIILAIIGAIFFAMFGALFF